MENKIVEFPEVDDASIVFGIIPKQKKWEQKAQEAGFVYMNDNIYSSYARTIFFTGGKMPEKKKDITDGSYKKGIRYFRCWLGSYSPKHERKEEVTGYILSLIADEKWIKKELNKKNKF